MDFSGIALNTVKVILVVGMPPLLVSMVIGLLISIFQAVTQVSDASLSFVPKLVLVLGFIMVTLPWIGDLILGYSNELWSGILSFGAKV